MKKKETYKSSKFDDREEDSAALKIYRMLSHYLSFSDEEMPFDDILEEVIKILDLDSAGIFIFNQEKNRVEKTYIRSKLENLYKNINPLDFLHFIQEERTSILIKDDEKLSDYGVNYQDMGNEFVVVPVLLLNNIIGLVIASKLSCRNILEYAKLLEMFSLQLSWILYNHDLKASLNDSNASLAIAKKELEEAIERETSELIDNEKKIEQIQSQLIQSEKFSAMGKLITGVAHEIKNPMTGIKGYVSLLSNLFDKLGLRKTHNNLIEGLEMSVSHLESVVTNFLSYSRKDEGKFEKVSIVDVLRRTEAIIKNFLQIRKIKLTIKNEEKLPKISGDLNQLVQVFMNLIINAEQAIFYNDGIIDVYSYYKNDRVFVEVRDNGIGIKESDTSRIFESFFTTKGLDKSSGIGLSVTKQIIDTHDGTIDVISKEMLGTKFVLSFPVAYS
ncbi:MAG: hypothetical protein DKM50_13940 [Candidatus Margulisiibacteriota bacterium]|nr:MAG: hypothetical protein A2X43_01190 [Candidatus Margulisbacteria bacterium GWD2_39_127]OGI03335.1 MAG: hypothetical protein A2X42_06975 [Candidatus Margulisbacteria bacterium GWF2_38_17]OGI12019.1 MAG: hypothetical protein A2X41_03055 [Candidatus Margulisbacteria bacterium GWE2_39_32]PZM77034.1 MAG: hypothetical protein DKM50_13940 [Candidatus Margulisiibacteriota bacterium]HAR63167.1 hypothetical protein [Candidatus Margulisiibacteriota bacterium]